MRTHIIEGKPKKKVTIEVDGHSLTLTEGIDITVIVVVAAQQSAQADNTDEINPVTQALRNLGDAIAPTRC